MSKRILVVVLLGIIATLLLRKAGSFLVVNAPEPSDLIVVMGRGNDVPYWNAVKLMQQGDAPRLLLAVLSHHRTFGQSDLELAQDLLNRTTPGQSALCPIAPISNYDEARFIAECLAASGAKSVLLVASDYHSRLVLSVMRKKLPQYRFSISTAPDPFYFGERWWTNREWAKSTLTEWEIYLWWILVEQWRSDALPHSSSAGEVAYDGVLLISGRERNH